MNVKHSVWIAAGVAAISLVTAPAFSQGSAPSGAPKTAAKAEEPAKPAPRLPDGKVDLGGRGVWAPIWVLDWADKKYVEHPVEVPFTAKGLELYNQRRANDSKDDPEGSVSLRVFRAIPARLTRSN
jgi:hypothetical protein